MKHLQIGTKIKSNGLMSPEAYGEVIGVQLGYSYYMTNMHLHEFFKEWAKIDPDWLLGPVYTVKKCLRDLPFYTEDERIPDEVREHIKHEWEKGPLVRQRFIVYLPAEIEALPDDYDWVQEAEDHINKKNDCDLL